MLLASLLLFAVAGIIAGFFSGLLGLGGGLTLVPLLSLAFTWSHLSASEMIMHLTLGTAMSCIFVNALSATWHRVRAGDFDNGLFLHMLPGTIIGTIAGCLTVNVLSGNTLRYIFLCVVLVALIKILHKIFKKVAAGHDAGMSRWPGRPVFAVVSVLTGLISSLSGGGAALMTTPFLSHYNYSMAKTSAQASALSGVIGLAATLTYIVTGDNATGLPSLSLGYVYLPAFITVVIFGFAGTKAGVMVSKVTSEHVQRIIFVLFLCLVIITMAREIAG